MELPRAVRATPSLRPLEQPPPLPSPSSQPASPAPEWPPEAPAAFIGLLNKLAAEHERVCSQNARLQAEVDRLSLSGSDQRRSRQSGANRKSRPSSADRSDDKKEAAGRGLAGFCSCSGSEEVLQSQADANSVEITIHRAPVCIPEEATDGDLNVPSRPGLLFDRDEVLEYPTSSVDLETWEVAASAMLPALPEATARSSPPTPTGGRRSRLLKLQERIELHERWRETDTSANPDKAAVRMSRSFSMKLHETNCIRGGDTLQDNNCLQRFVMGPNSKRRVVWDMLSLIILGYDILTVPMVSFDLPPNILLKAMDYSCTVFWTLDVPASLTTGYHDAGILEMRPSKIAHGYFRSWFFFDFLVISVDWLMILTESGMADLIGLFRISKVVRMVRIIRLFRLLRLLKLPALMDELGDYIQSEHLFTAFGVMRSLTIIAIVNHFIACCWYAIGQLGSPGWVQKLDDEDRNLGYRYATALHWSLTQFTPSSMEIHPRNVLERVFSICVLFTALVVFSSFVSSITNAMTQLHQANRQKTKQREDIRKYISDNKLSLELANRIVAFVRKNRASSRKRVHESEIEVLKVLPESLRLQLHWEVYQPVMIPHPFFHNLNEFDDGCMLDICHNAMGERSLSSSQELFTAGQPAEKVYFMLSGLLEYYHEASDSDAMEVSKGQWCSEAILWIKWDHEGRLAAVSHCELVTLDAQKFRKVTTQRPRITQICSEYARLFKKEFESGMTMDKPLDIWMDHDSLVGMALDAFGKRAGDDENEMPRRPWKIRPWRTLSLIRKKPQSPMKFTKSNSMP